MKNKTNFKNILIGILFIIVILIISIFYGNYYFIDNINNNSNLYEDIGIDSSKLNVLFLNVGQRR